MFSPSTSAALFISIVASAILVQLSIPAAPAEKAKTPPVVENPTAVALGVYACLRPGPGGQNVPAPRKINVNDELNYTLYLDGDRVKQPGRYEFRDGRMHWLSGPLASADPGEYEGDLHARPAQMVVKFRIPGQLPLTCYMTDEPG